MHLKLRFEASPDSRNPYRASSAICSNQIKRTFLNGVAKISDEPELAKQQANKKGSFEDPINLFQIRVSITSDSKHYQFS